MVDFNNVLRFPKKSAVSKEGRKKEEGWKVKNLHPLSPRQLFNGKKILPSLSLFFSLSLFLSWNSQGIPSRSTTKQVSVTSNTEKLLIKWFELRTIAMTNFPTRQWSDTITYLYDTYCAKNTGWKNYSEMFKKIGKLYLLTKNMSRVRKLFVCRTNDLDSLMFVCNFRWRRVYVPFKEKRRKKRYNYAISV